VLHLYFLNFIIKREQNQELQFFLFYFVSDIDAALHGKRATVRLGGYPFFFVLTPLKIPPTTLGGILGEFHCFV
jgi:hypothetical protein